MSTPSPSCQVAVDQVAIAIETVANTSVHSVDTFMPPQLSPVSDCPGGKMMLHRVFDASKAGAVNAAMEAISSGTRYAVIEEKDVWYNSDLSTRHRKHKLDIFIPERPVTPTANCSATAKPLLPMVVFVHGGGWKKFGRRTVGGMHGNVGRSLSARGFLTIIPSYRLSSVSLFVVGPLYAVLSACFGLAALARMAVMGRLTIASALYTYPISAALCFLLPSILFFAIESGRLSSGDRGKRTLWPTHAHDVAQAVAWAVQHGAEYGGDTSRIAIVGHSAGGHIAAMLALQPEVFLSSAGVPDYKDRIRAVAVCSGVLSGRLLCPPSMQDQGPHPLGSNLGRHEAKCSDGSDSPRSSRGRSPVTLLAERLMRPNGPKELFVGTRRRLRGVCGRISLAFRRWNFQYSVFNSDYSVYEQCFPVDLCRQDPSLLERKRVVQAGGECSPAICGSWGAGLPLPPLLLVNASVGQDWGLLDHTDAWEEQLCEAGLHVNIGDLVQDERVGMGSQDKPLFTPAQLSSPFVSRVTLCGTDHIGYIWGMGAGLPMPTRLPTWAVSPVLAHVSKILSHARHLLGGGSTHRHATAGEHVFAPVLVDWLNLNLGVEGVVGK